MGIKLLVLVAAVLWITTGGLAFIGVDDHHTRMVLAAQPAAMMAVGTSALVVLRHWIATAADAFQLGYQAGRISRGENKTVRLPERLAEGSNGSRKAAAP